MSIVLLSGGMDSAICLSWAKREFGSEPTRAVFFDYGQRHLRPELDSARRIARRCGVTLESFVIDPSLFGMTGDVYHHRNLVMLSMAAAASAADGPGRQGIGVLVMGACKEDADGFSDCRPGFFMNLDDTLWCSDERHLSVATPLLHMTKRESLELAEELGCMDDVRASWSCYKPRYHGARAPSPCLECSACKKREAALCE